MQVSCRNHELPSNIKDRLDFREEDRRHGGGGDDIGRVSPGISGYQAFADFCPHLTLTESRGTGLGKAASCHTISLLIC